MTKKKTTKRKKKTAAESPQRALLVIDVPAWCETLEELGDWLARLTAEDGEGIENGAIYPDLDALEEDIADGEEYVLCGLPVDDSPAARAEAEARLEEMEACE